MRSLLLHCVDFETTSRETNQPFYFHALEVVEVQTIRVVEGPHCTVSMWKSTHWRTKKKWASTLVT